MFFKRLFALLLALMLIVSAIPFVGAVSKEPEDIWEAISALEDTELARRKAGSANAQTPSAADFAAMSDEVEALVRSSADYKPGTISRHGDFFFWESLDGTPNGYSPRLRAKIRESALADADPEAYSGIETVSYAPRGGWAGSINVASFQPYYGIDTSFQVTYATEGQRIAKALGGTSTNYKTNDATIDNIAKAMEECGVIIFDSHGDTDYAGPNEDYTSRANTSYICLQSGTGFTAADQQSVQGTYGTYYHAYYGGGYGSMNYYMADGTAIANHMTGNGQNSLLWMAICLGMATEGLQKPLREKGVEVVYGYSQSVTFSGDYKYEKQFWNHMIDGYTAGESFAYMKEKCGCDWDPAYSGITQSQAVAEHAAFPIMVSSEDRYPGHGNVDKVTTPVSTWTLYTQFAIEAVSNNDDWGTVSSNGGTIIATPAEGYFAEGYTLLEGTATITQDGNVFTVKPESDCKIQINFAAKTPATLRFITPDGVSCSDIHTYVNDPVQLPIPADKPADVSRNYRFLGWTEARVDNVTERPSFLPGGTKQTVTGDATYYALYTYAVAEGDVSVTSYDKLELDPGNWEGSYVLTYNSSVVLDASGENTGSGLGSKNAAVALESTGIVPDGNTLTEVDDKYVYAVEPSAVTPGAYTIRMLGSENYIAYIGNTNSITTVTNAANASAQWYLRYENGLAVIQNVNTPARYIQYNTTTKNFRCYLNTMKNLTLYAGVLGTSYFTTELGSACEHSYESVVTAPACTVGGYTTYTCTKCGYSYVDDRTEPLGHDFQYAQTVAPTAEAQGYDLYVCSRCDAQEQRNFTEPQPGNPFVDVAETDYFYDAVLWAVNAKPQITAGTDETHFSPNNPCTRAQVVTFLWRAFGAPEAGADAENGFTDVKTGAYYYDAVLWAVVNQVTSGTSGTLFSPDASCTRAQVVTFLWRANGEPEPTAEGSQTAFTDVKDTAFYYKAVLWAVQNGITAGTGNGKFSPNSSCTRAQVVTFLYRAFH